MDWLILLPVLLLLFAAALLLPARRSIHWHPLRRCVPPLLVMAGVSLLLLLARTALVHRLLPAERASAVLWLVFLVFLLVFTVRMVSFTIFDLFYRRRGIRYSKLMKDVVVLILYLIGLILIIKFYFNRNITGLLVSSALLTVVIGFALQDSLGNMISGIILNLEDTLKVGDWARVKEIEGKIEQFGWRSVKLRTIDNQLVVIPNQVISKEAVLLYESSHRPFAQRIRVGVGYHCRPDTIISILEGAVAQVHEVRREPAAQVNLFDFADSAVIFEIKYWIDDYARRMPIASEVRRAIWYALQRQGIEIPFPQRTLHIERRREGGPDRRELQEALRQDVILQALDESTFAELTAECDAVVYGRGEVIIHEGVPSDHFYHILEGRVHIVKNEAVLVTLAAGDFFGEISLVTGELPGATVRAEQECTVIRISSRRFKESVKMNERMALVLSEIIIRRQAELREFTARHTAVDSQVLKRDSENLFRRIVKYFNLSADVRR